MRHGWPGSLPLPDHSRLGRSGRYTTGTATAEPSSGGWEVPLFRETKAGFRDRGRRSAPARPHRGRGRTYAQTPDGGCSGARLLEHPPPWLHPPGHCHCPGSAARRGRRLGLRMAVGLHVVPAGPGSAARAVQAAPDAGEPRLGRLAKCPPPVDGDRSASRTLGSEPFGAGAAEIAKRGHARSILTRARWERTSSDGITGAGSRGREGHRRSRCGVRPGACAMLEHYRDRNALRVYAHPHALRAHLAEAREAIARAEEIVRTTPWPDDEDYDAA
jgi:hypothetical protein